VTASTQTFPDTLDSPSHAAAWWSGRVLPSATGHFNELTHSGLEHADLAPEWSSFFSHVTDGPAGLDLRQTQLQRQLRDNGVSYNVYADAQTLQRPWSLELFPLLLTPEDWTEIETGIQQRARLLNHILTDLYGNRQLSQRGLLPMTLAQGHPGFMHAMDGVQPLGQTWLHIAAFDLGRNPDGHWNVLAQRTQAPSGLGYLLENRIAISRQFPQAFENMRVQRLAASYQSLIQSLIHLSPKGRDARIALLTPGPYNETYFEHAYLARYLGLSLVEGHDLTVRDQHVYLKTLQGLEPVDVLIKRLDDDWLDPLELRADSTLGVPGLMQAVRAGHVLLANTPGSAPLESPALLDFLPDVALEVLGEPLRLHPTQAIHRAQNHGIGNANPHALSQLPTWRGQTLSPASLVLRVFALAQGSGQWRVLPGGMVRLPAPGQNLPSMQGGGSSADCWVLSHGPVDRTSLLQQAPTTLSLVRQKRPVTSRAAENLFWLGRYTERTDNALRLLRLTLRSLQGEESGSHSLLAWLSVCNKAQGLLPSTTPNAQQSTEAFQCALWQQASAQRHTGSLGHNLRSLQSAAHAVRERLSGEQRKLIERADALLNGLAAPTHHSHASVQPVDPDTLDQLNDLLAAITGHQTDHMLRDDGWRMLSIGRHIERAATLSAAMAAAVQTGSLFEDAGFEALLALFDSTLTFHAHYPQRRDLLALLDVLLTHPDNPRSLAWVLSTLRSRVDKLPDTPGQPVLSLLRDLPDPRTWDLLALSAVHPESSAAHHGYLDLLQLLQSCEDSVYRLSDRLGHAYFSHADSLSQSLLS